MFPRIYYSIPPPLFFSFSFSDCLVAKGRGGGKGGKRGEGEGKRRRRSGATRRTTSTTTTTKVKNVECLRMWRRQIEVGHSFQIPFAGRNNLHLPSHPLNRTRQSPGSARAETGLEFIISHFHGPL